LTDVQRLQATFEKKLFWISNKSLLPLPQTSGVEKVFFKLGMFPFFSFLRPNANYTERNCDETQNPQKITFWTNLFVVWRRLTILVRHLNPSAIV